MSLLDELKQQQLRALAQKHGLNPDTMLKLVNAEGGNDWRSKATKNGMIEPSFGHFQLLKGGKSTGFPLGMGNDYQSATGLDPADPANSDSMDDYAMGQIRKRYDSGDPNPLSPWYGAKRAGLTGRNGIVSTDATGSVSNTGAPPSPERARFDALAMKAGVPNDMTADADMINSADPKQPPQFNGMGMDFINKGPGGVSVLAPPTVQQPSTVGSGVTQDATPSERPMDMETEPAAQKPGFLERARGVPGLGMALVRAGAGLAENASKGWGAGIGAAFGGAADAFDQDRKFRLAEGTANLDIKAAYPAIRQHLIASGEPDNEDTSTKAFAIAANPSAAKAAGLVLDNDVSPGFHLAANGKDWEPTVGGPHDPKVIESEAMTRASAQGKALVESDEVTNIFEGMKSGDLPPTTTGMYRYGVALKARAAKEHFNLSKAQLEYKAAEQQIKSLNAPRMIAFQGTAKSVLSTIGEVEALSQELKNGGFTGLNKTKLELLVHTAGNTPQGILASRYLAAANTLKAEFANLESGGYAPTGDAWNLANEQIRSEYGVDQMSATLGEIKRLVNYRYNAIPGIHRAGAGAANRYTGETGEMPEYLKPISPNDHGAPAPGAAPSADSVPPGLSPKDAEDYATLKAHDPVAAANFLKLILGEDAVDPELEAGQ